MRAEITCRFLLFSIGLSFSSCPLLLSISSSYFFLSLFSLSLSRSRSRSRSLSLSLSLSPVLSLPVLCPVALHALLANSQTTYRAVAATVREEYRTNKGQSESIGNNRHHTTGRCRNLKIPSGPLTSVLRCVQLFMLDLIYWC